MKDPDSHGNLEQERKLGYDTKQLVAQGEREKES